MPRGLSSWLKVGLLVLGVVAAAFALRGLGHIFRLILIGGVFAYLLDPFARALESRGLSRRVATALICSGLVLVLAVVTYAISPVVVTQITGLRQGFDASDVDRLLERVDWIVNSALVRLGVDTVDVPAVVYDWFSHQSINVLGLVPNFLSLLVDILLIPFIMFFLLRDGPDMKKTFISWIPNHYFEFALTVVHKSSRKLSGYLRGQALESLVVGILSSVALWLIGVDYYLLIGLFAGLANMIPYVGPFAGGVLAVCVSALTLGSFADAPWIIISFGIVQAIDNLLIQPLVISRHVQMHPLGIILVLIVGGQLFGLWGLLLAVPTAAIAKVIVTELVANVRRFRLA